MCLGWLKLVNKYWLIRLEENRIMGRYPSPMARIDSAYHYPKYVFFIIYEIVFLVLRIRMNRTILASGIRGKNQPRTANKNLLFSNPKSELLKKGDCRKFPHF